MKLVSGFLSAVLKPDPVVRESPKFTYRKSHAKAVSAQRLLALMPVPEARISSRIVSMSSYPVGPVHSSVAGNRSLSLSLVILAQPSYST